MSDDGGTGPSHDDGARTPYHSGEDEVFPEDFRRLMRRVFGPLNRWRSRRG